MDDVVGIEPVTVTGSQRVKALLVALVCALFLLNLSGGWMEIPDCLPVVGNLDEVAATVLLLRCLKHLGWTTLPRPQ